MIRPQKSGSMRRHTHLKELLCGNMVRSVWLVSNDKATAVSFWFSTDSKYVLALELSKQREQRAGVNFDGKLSEGPLAVIPSLAALNKSWSCS